MVVGVVLSPSLPPNYHARSTSCEAKTLLVSEPSHAMDFVERKKNDNIILWSLIFFEMITKLASYQYIRQGKKTCCKQYASFANFVLVDIFISGSCEGLPSPCLIFTSNNYF